MAVIDGKTYVARGGEVYESIPEVLTDRVQIRAMLRSSRELIAGMDQQLTDIRARRTLVVARRNALQLLIDASGGE